MATTDPYNIDSLFRAALYDPTELSILTLIKKDSNALGINYTIHLAQNLHNDKDGKGVARSMILIKLIDDGLVAQDGLGYKLTKAGEKYLKRNNPEWAYWSAKYSYIAIWVACVGVLIAVITWLFPRQNTTTPQPSGVVYKSSGDSLSPKNDTIPVVLPADMQKRQPKPFYPHVPDTLKVKKGG